MRVRAQIRAVPAVPVVQEVVLANKADPAKQPAVPAKARVVLAKAVRLLGPGAPRPHQLVGPALEDPAKARVVLAKAVRLRGLEALRPHQRVAPAKARVVPAKAVRLRGLEALRPHQLVGPALVVPAKAPVVPAMPLDLRLHLRLALDQRLDLAWPGLDDWPDRVRVDRVKVGQVRVVPAKAPVVPAKAVQLRGLEARRPHQLVGPARVVAAPLVLEAPEAPEE